MQNLPCPALGWGDTHPRGHPPRPSPRSVASLPRNSRRRSAHLDFRPPPPKNFGPWRVYDIELTFLPSRLKQGALASFKNSPSRLITMASCNNLSSLLLVRKQGALASFNNSPSRLLVGKTMAPWRVHRTSRHRTSRLIMASWRVLTTRLLVGKQGALASLHNSRLLACLS